MSAPSFPRRVALDVDFGEHTEALLLQRGAHPLHGGCERYGQANSDAVGHRVGSLPGWWVDQPQVLPVAEQVQAAAQDRVVDGLAVVAGNGTPLPLAGHRQRNVDLRRVPAGERGTELGVEPLGDAARHPPPAAPAIAAPTGHPGWRAAWKTRHE